MGMFAFRRMREREAASHEVASFATPEPPKLEEKPPQRQKPAKPKPTDGDRT